MLLSSHVIQFRILELDGYWSMMKLLQAAAA